MNQPDDARGGGKLVSSRNTILGLFSKFAQYLDNEPTFFHLVSWSI